MGIDPLRMVAIRGYMQYFDCERIFPPSNRVLFLNFLPQTAMLTSKPVLE